MEEGEKERVYNKEEQFCPSQDGMWLMPESEYKGIKNIL